MMEKKKQVCIIKLDGLGDVLRTTAILRCFRNDEVTWITEEAAFFLLAGSPFVKKITTLSGILAAQGVEFDELYNFDEDIRACKLAHNLKAKKKKGFGIKNGRHFPFDADSEYAYALSKNDELKFRLNKKTYQQIIFEMAGCRWEGQDYVLGYQPKGAVKYEVGINYLVGKKFPNKAWPRWKELSGMLDSVCLQNQFKTLKEYIDWVNSCRILVTGDSLGMHIALALKKKVIILMGSTSWHEIETYGRGIILKAGLSCSPCYKKNKCSRASFCMDLITPEMVCSEIKNICQSGY
ncbi:MAG: glycosyltransferase family 9 protein [Candidatus Omnitrophica bacterium]|nr:glycosyltransferase family 9 protein [Candidatus Omnitrophota bacterium]